MLCYVCNRQIEQKELITCITCKHKYHIRCGNITSADYKEHSDQLKRTWKCAPCVNSFRRMRSDDTPIRSTASATLDKSGMSCDGSFESPQEVAVNVSPSCTTNSKIPQDSASISYADFGKLGF